MAWANSDRYTGSLCWNGQHVSVRRLGRRMVRWLGPTGLVVNAYDELVSGVLRRWADTRPQQRTLPDDLLPKGRSGERYPPGEPLWIDYLADIGDGWRSTYSVAWLLCRSHELGGRRTDAGRIVVLGGDQVYPLAGRTRYRERLVEPYAMASRSLVPGEQDLYAVPGNHDWYDRLRSFMGLFRAGAELGAWRTPQTRSYFAIQLPHRWWLIGIDIAFGGGLDDAQCEHFRHRCGDANHQINPGDRVILCTGKPTWSIRCLTTDPRLVAGARDALLEDLEREILVRWKCQLPLVLSGDLHHYSRYATADGSRHWVTAGGGEAYLYPTRGLASSSCWSGLDLRRQAAYPTAAATEPLRSRLLMAPFINPPFLVMVGTLHALAAIAVIRALAAPDVSVADALADATITEVFVKLLVPPAALVVALASAALLAYTDAATRLERLVATLLHSGAHISTMVASTALATWAAAHAPDLPSWMRPLGSLDANAHLAALVAASGAGAVFGSIVFGVYLRLQELRDRHGNDAFAALHVSDWKSFVRLELGPDGALTLYGIGIPTVAGRRSLRTADDGENPIIPDGPPTVVLVDGPVVVAHPAASHDSNGA
jgi:hypothetical protein